jgi:hypothetical protein
LRHRFHTAIALSLAAILLAACAGGAPVITLLETEVHLGEVVNGEIVDLSLSVRNSGDRPLIIEAVSTSCGCTSAEIQPQTIAPGAEGLLIIEYDSGAHGPEETGPIMRQIFIASNDPDQPEAEVRITADVLAPQ